MSQQLTPVNGGVSQISVSPNIPARNQVLSPQYIAAKDLETRPTEWVNGGRPIYGRLPAASQTYRINFEADGEIGYVYIPIGEGINGPTSLEVVASNSKQDLLIKGGSITWKYGTTKILPTIVNLPVLNIESAKFLVSYQMIFDDSPKDFQYSVEDFLLCGTPLTISSNTDSVIGWRYPAKNAFIDGTARWSGTDSLFSSFSVGTPTLQWISEKPYAFNTVRLLCPENTAYTGTATLSYVDASSNVLVVVQTVNVSRLDTRQFYEFRVESPSFQNGWKVTWTDTNVSINEVRVSGILTFLEKQYAPSTRGALVMYPENRVPKTIFNGNGEEVPATYCDLAYVDIDENFNILKIQDVRNLTNQPYVPIANWLTYYYDKNLINLKNQIEHYPTSWMSPVDCLKQEYVALTKDNIQVL